MAGAPLALLDALTDGGDFFRARFAARLTPMPGLGLRPVGALAQTEREARAGQGVVRSVETPRRNPDEIGEVSGRGAVERDAVPGEIVDDLDATLTGDVEE